MCLQKRDRVKCGASICDRKTEMGWAVTLPVQRTKSQQRWGMCCHVLTSQLLRHPLPFLHTFPGLCSSAQTLAPSVLLLGVGRKKKQVTDRLTPASLNNVTNSSPLPPYLPLSKRHSITMAKSTQTHTRAHTLFIWFFLPSSAPTLPVPSSQC